MIIGQLTEIFQIKDPTILLLIIVFFFVFAFFGAIRQTGKSSEGFQTLATNMAGNYQVSSAQALSLTEKVGELSVRVTQLDMEVSALKARLKDSDGKYKEALEKIDTMSGELAKVRKQLDDANTLLIIRDTEKAALVAHVEALQLEVDKLHGQILELQSGTPPAGTLISQEIQSNITTTTTKTLQGDSSS